MKTKILSVIIFAFLFSMNAFAHEYWFEPETFFSARGDKTAVHLYVGDGLVKDREERVYQSEKTPMFQLFSTYKTWDLKTSLTEGQMPIYNFSAEKVGNYLLAMERNWSYITLESNKFEDYLREDGMEYIIAERAKLGENQKEGRERYSRFIKSLLQVGDKRDDTYKKLIRLKLEIMPLENLALAAMALRPHRRLALGAVANLSTITSSRDLHGMASRIPPTGSHSRSPACSGGQSSPAIRCA